MKRAKEFYTDGLDLRVKKAFGNKFVMFEGQDGTSDLGMYKREALAEDAAVPPDGSGLLARAAEAGGQIVMPARAGDRRGYFGYFADLDGNLWQVATRN